ncbi:DUF5906 domain-containing protein [Methylobacterium sp. A52T]
MKGRAKSTPVFRNATKSFRDAGISINYLLPIAPPDGHIGATGTLKSESMGKSPGRYDRRRNEWRGLFGSFIKEGVPERDAVEFEDWPTDSVGLLGRYVPAIDSDAESDEARELVERVLDEVFPRQGYAERLRGDGHRRLYAFECPKPDDMEAVVRGRHLSYRLNGVDSKIDVIGYGNQFLAAGLHQNRRDRYEWHPDRNLFELWDRQEIALLDNATVNRFLGTFVDELERAGGEVLRQSGGAAIGEDRDYSNQDATMPLGAVLAGLDRLPNTEANFPHRDDLVGVLAAIRATLGSEAEAAADDIEEWATRHGWCDGEYFRKCWDSLHRGVRVSRNSLTIMFRQNKIFPDMRTVFPDDEVSKAARARIAVAEDERAKLLQEVMRGYVFGRVNMRTDDSTLRMRNVFEPGVEFRGFDWWNGRTEDPRLSLVAGLRRHFDPTENGFWDFVRAMRGVESALPEDAPRCFYVGETKNPLYERGAVVPEAQPDGSPMFLLNMRFQSPVIRFAKDPPKNPVQSEADLKTLLDFMGRVFGEQANYELDTLAYMVQSGRRPGHMLFLQGDHGVGKSIYVAMLVSMFDGTGRDQGGQIDGTKMMNEASRRFALANVEGCRIISIKELPDGSSLPNQKAVTAALKQLVDPGPDGDFFQIEEKRINARMVRNFARVVSTSNYNRALEVETQDRRIFYVACGITQENKPNERYYADLTSVTLNPERLATLWRYLERRDVRGYNAAKAPPVTREKREVQIAGLDAWDRHMQAAVEVFRNAGRWIFDMKEFAAIMSQMSVNERENTKRDVDDTQTYDFGKTPALAKRLSKYAQKIIEVRSNGARIATVYGLRTARPLIQKLAEANGPEILDELDQDRADNRLSSDHVWPTFSGPPKPADRRQ